MSTPTLEYALDARVLVLTGKLAGLVGTVDEIDPTDPVDTYRVRFGNTARWFSGRNLMLAEVAR